MSSDEQPATRSDLLSLTVSHAIVYVAFIQQPEGSITSRAAICRQLFHSTYLAIAAIYSVT